MRRIDNTTLPFFLTDLFSGSEVFSPRVITNPSSVLVNQSQDQTMDFDFGGQSLSPNNLYFDLEANTDEFTTTFTLSESSQSIVAPPPEGVFMIGARLNVSDDSSIDNGLIGVGVDFDASTIFIAIATFNGLTQSIQRIDEQAFSGSIFGREIKVTSRQSLSVDVSANTTPAYTASHSRTLVSDSIYATPYILCSPVSRGYSLSEWSVCGLTDSEKNSGSTLVDDCGHLSNSVTPDPDPDPTPVFMNQPLLGSVSVEPFDYVSSTPLLMTNNTQNVVLANLAGSIEKDIISDATVTYSLVLEQNNKTIINESAMTYNESSDSYNALLDGSLLIRGLIYTLTVKATKGESVGEWRQLMTAQDRMLKVIGAGAKLY